jgi:hypothetical protein
MVTTTTRADRFGLPGSQTEKESWLWLCPGAPGAAMAAPDPMANAAANVAA